MSLIILEPQQNSNYHPAYRYLNVWSLNAWATPADHYGAEIELTINGVAGPKLFSRKDVGLLLGHHVYEFDLQSVLQDLLKWDLPEFGDEKDFIHSSSALYVEGTCYDYYLDASGMVTKDTTSGAAITPFVVTNTTLQHEQWHGNPAIWHFTMNSFLPTVTGSGFDFLTNSSDFKKVCLEDSEWLPFLLDDPFGFTINAVRVRSYNALGGINGTGLYFLQAPVTDAGFNYVKNCFRSIGAGPANIIKTTALGNWDYQTILAPFALPGFSYESYTIELGYWDGTHHPTSGFTSFRTRTYVVGCPCCKDRQAVYFLNQYGAIDTMAFDAFIEVSNPVKSTGYEKNLSVPHNRRDTGSERLSVTGAPVYKVSKILEDSEFGAVQDLINAIKIWVWTGNDYVPMKIKDENYKLTIDGDSGYFVEFEFEYANAYLSLRN